MINNSPNVSDATKKKVFAAMKEQGYQVNILAKGLKGNRTNIIVVFADRHHEEHLSIWHNIMLKHLLSLIHIYCKIDILVENDRNGQLFFQEHELDSLNQTLKEHGIGDLRQLIRMAEEIGREEGLSLSATTDAKYLEVGLSSKSDNVNAILERLGTAWGIQAEDCSFWGDEYIGLSERCV